MTNDTRAQQIYEATGSMTWYPAGLEGCGGANSTTTSNDFVMNDLLGKYQFPFGVQLPMDGYSHSCSKWATSVVNGHSDLLTFNSTSAICAGITGSYTCANSWVRVDDMNFAVQTYNDLVSVKNTILNSDAKALQYWTGVYISGVASDGGNAQSPGAEVGQDTIWHFAKSAYCATVTTSSNCALLASEVSDIQSPPSPSAFGYLSGGTFGALGVTSSCLGGCYGQYVDQLTLLGYTYAAYNFSQKYDTSHPFVVLPAKPAYSCPASTALYPFPYNTTSIESLNLCQYEVLGYGAVENGYGASQATVRSNEALCLSQGTAGIPGLFAVTMNAAGQAASVPLERNLLYYQALCAGASIEDNSYGGLANWQPYPSNSYFWNLQPPFATILNRMENVGFHQFPKVALVGGYGTYPNITNVTLLGGVGVPLLAWFYTNATGGATASISLNAARYHLSNNWCAVSLLTLAVISCAGSPTISLNNILIPATNNPGWNPIYVFNSTSSSLRSILYSSMRVTSTSTNSSAIVASLAGPHALGAWVMVHDSQAPARISSNRTGSLSEYPSLASLNRSLIGESYAGSGWGNYTQQGWYYDSTNSIVYVHFEMGGPVQIGINNQASGVSVGTDGSATGCQSNVSSYTLSPLTTGSTNVIVIVGTTILGSSVSVSGISDTAGLSWSARSGQVISGSGSQATDTVEWYAKSASPLSLDTITVTLTGAGSACSNAFAVKGANFDSPFDPNPALPFSDTAPPLSISSPTAFGISSANSGQVTGGENTQKFFHAAGYFLVFYENSGNGIYYQTCHDSTDCTQATNWSHSTPFFSGTVQPESEDFSIFYDYANNVVYCVVLLGGQTIGWFSGNVSAGVITTSPSNPTQHNIGTFSTNSYEVANSDPQIILDRGGDLIFGIATSGGEVDHIEVWKCAGASPSCTETNIHILNLGSPPSPPLPTLFALANGGIALSYSPGNYNYATRLSYTSCPSGCSSDGSWSLPVATSGNYMPGSCIQDESYMSSDTIYCVADALSNSPTSFLTFAYGGTSWTESTLDPATAQAEGISANGNGVLVVTYCISASTCYYNASPNSGSTWDGKRTLTTAANAFQSGSLQAAEFMQSSDGYSLDFVSPGGSSSPYSVYFVKTTNYLSTPPTVASVSTSNSADFAFDIFGYYNSTAQTLGTIGGLTASAVSLGSGGTAPINAIEYVTAGSALSGSSCSFGTPVYNWAAICDAIQALPGTVITTTSSSQTSSSTTSTSSSSQSSSSTSNATSTTTSTVTTTNSTFLSSSSQSSTSSSSSSTSPGAGNGAATNSTLPVTSIANPFSFHILLSSVAVSVVAGSAGEITASVLLDSGARNAVGLTAAGVPSGVSASFTPTAGTVGFVSVLLLATSTSTAPGTYQISVVGRSGEVVQSSSFELTVTPAPPAAPVTYVETISSSPQQGGTTDPSAGRYDYQANQLVTVTALPSSGWSLNHWLLNGNPAGNGTQFSFILKGDVKIVAVFSNATSQGPPSASVSFSASGTTSSDVVIDGTTYSLPTSFGWTVGSSHQVSAQSLVQAGGTEVVLEGWQGALNSSSPALSFTVENDMTLIAEYQTKYLVDFVFVGSDGAPVTAQNATIYGPGGLTIVTSANSSAWLEAGATYTPLGGAVGGVVLPVLAGFGSFSVDNPETVTIALATYPVSIKLVDLFGQPISGANVTLTTSGQGRFTQVTGKDGVATFNNVPMGWFDATYRYLGVSGSLSSTATGAHSDNVTMALSYPVISVVVVFISIVVFSLVRLRLRRGQADGGYDEYYD